MTKIEIIKILTDNGIFELTSEIIDTIKSDESPAHSSANKNILSLITKVDQMQSWTQFSWKDMIDLTAQAFGFVKFAAYSNLDVCADVIDQMEELHLILWNNFSKTEVWNG